MTVAESTTGHGGIGTVAHESLDFPERNDEPPRSNGPAMGRVTDAPRSSRKRETSTSRRSHCIPTRTSEVAIATRAMTGPTRSTRLLLSATIVGSPRTPRSRASLLTSAIAASTERSTSGDHTTQEPPVHRSPPRPGRALQRRDGGVWSAHGRARRRSLSARGPRAFDRAYTWFARDRPRLTRRVKCTETSCGAFAP